MKVKIISKKRLYKGFLNLDSIELKHIKHDGSWSEAMLRLNLKRGEAAAVLVYLKDTDSFILVNQFRYACYENGESGWIDEIVAGVFDENDTAETCAKRECIEETGYVIENLKFVNNIYVSPGITNERITIFIGIGNSNDKKYSGGGVSHEHEDIRIVEYSKKKAYELLKSGYFKDGKTIIALQYFQLYENELTH